MGTTVVLAQFLNDRVFVAGVGDSRAYRLREGRLEQLTKDHSLADALLDAGTITAEELPTHKFKNVLYLYLGSKDARSGPEDVRVLDVRPGDRLLMASDGLTGVVPDTDLVKVLGTIDDPQQASRILVEMALANDSKEQRHLPDHSRGRTNQYLDGSGLTAMRCFSDRLWMLRPDRSQSHGAAGQLYRQRHQVGAGPARDPDPGPSSA